MISYPKITTNENNKSYFDKKSSYFGLPFEVKFCKKCVISNQRPNSAIEYKHNSNSKKETISFNENGICDACYVNELKEKKIDWEKRDKELVDLCNKYRGNGKDYDCIVPGSGGKDSFYVSHMLKYKYNMNPLTITWAPHMYTPTGIKNMENWVNAGFDNYLVTPNRKVQRLLTRLSLENLFHPFQPFQFGQKFLAPKLALKLGINLVFYGENAAEYGNASSTLQSAKMDTNYFSIDKIKDDEIFLGGESLTSLKNNFGLGEKDIQNYLPIEKRLLKDKDISVYYFGHFKKWHPQSNYYYAVENGNFITNSERMPGTYTKYNSNDDKMEYLNYYTTGIKYGIGWTSYVASFEVRDGDLTREEALSLVKKYDLEFPTKFEDDFYTYLSVKEEELPEAAKMFENPIFDRDYFMTLHDKFRSPHIWKKENDKWTLRKTSWKDAEKSNLLETDQLKSASNWTGNIFEK